MAIESDPGSISRRTLFGLAGAAIIPSFAQAASAAIPAGAETVQTAGFAATRRGAALYVTDPQVNAAYVQANPRTSFVAADGRGFRLSLDQVVTPFMFGAVGAAAFTGDTAALPDDTAALQAFFDFCAGRPVPSANWGGFFGVSAELTLGGKLGEPQSFTDTLMYQGAILLGVKANINGAVLRVRTHRGCTYGPIVITSNDYYADWGRRLFDFGIIVEDLANLQVFTFIEVSQARVAGLLCSTTYRPDRLKPNQAISIYSNVFANEFVNSYFHACGSGSLHLGSFLRSGYSGKANSGASGWYDQITTMNVATLPPPIAENYGVPLFVRVAGQLHEIMNIDRGAGRIRVYPWVDLNSPSSGTLDYVFGGGMVMEGGDAGLQSGKVAATNCSAGLVNAALYNGHFIGTFQNNLIATVVGSSHGNAALGGTLKGYFEGNQIDLLWNAAIITTAYYTILAQHALDPAKIKGFTRRRSDNSLLPLAMPYLLMNGIKGWHAWEAGPSAAGGWDHGYATFDERNGLVVPLHGDNPLIEIAPPPNSVLTDLFGYRARTFQITGGGEGNRPRGRLTVRPGVGKRVNGGAPGADGVFPGPFSGPLTIQVAIDPADPNNFLVSFMSGR